VYNSVYNSIGVVECWVLACAETRTGLVLGDQPILAAGSVQVYCLACQHGCGWIPVQATVYCVIDTLVA
jgi:hypothetical protein